MEKVADYNELDRLEKIEGREVLVLFSNLIHRVIGGQWQAVGKVTQDGEVVYRR
ncbi:MAG: hypothetical protein AAB385_07120 [Planctomycetota bacterium]